LDAWLTRRTTVSVSIIRHQAFHMEIFKERVIRYSQFRVQKNKIKYSDVVERLRTRSESDSEATHTIQYGTIQFNTLRYVTVW
jgi:hypothetical protein